MRINLLSSFAAGILLTTSICSVVYLTNDHVSTKTKETDKTITVQPSVKEMQKKLVAKGYIVQKKADYDKNLKAAKATTAKQSTKETTTKKAVKDTTTKQAATENDKPSKKVVTVNVTEGMTSFDVGKMLIPSKIVSDAFEFSQIIEQRGLSNKLRPGTYVVDSEMTFDQVLSTIFK
ncbi:mannitol-specific phosphotransferase system IIBC component [Bacillus sp. SLBN-46]|uniref:aminodeoxychorismate lyase n=1 Tax=Bacillus sp. SLBN-46 TaxID=3042283 RepID=UPI0028656E65|nr:aminodeoxychorismate lyase [Bacillus sp. SLBN-46]MDR6123148.1 mannitol-specific phosphotransferase system IIBC component [Bacillus sp. SLBN-46]